MKVELVNATENPEVELCRAARNDYRSDGIIGYSFDDIMDTGDEISSDDSDVQWLRENEWFKDRFEHGVTAVRVKKLIDHLMKSGHWGPFEHPQATIAIEGVTRVVTHQLVRHRHFTYDQQSLRYVEVDASGDSREELEDTFQFPPFIDDGEVVSREGVEEIDPEYVEKYYKAAYSAASDWYNALLEEGVPREQARKVLPMGVKTNIVISGNARAWMHILNVRDKGDVQGETQRCAKAINEELEEWMPYTFQKYKEDIRPLRLNP